MNEVLGEIAGKEEYGFKLKAIIVNENGVNFCGITEMFGLDLMMSIVVSCQIHFKNDVHKASPKLGSSFKGEFKKTSVQCLQWQ